MSIKRNKPKITYSSNASTRETRGKLDRDSRERDNRDTREILARDKRRNYGLWEIEKA